MTQNLIRALGLVAAMLLLAGACSNHWLDHVDLHFGLLGLNADGRDWMWHRRWIEIAMSMREPLARTLTFYVAGIVTVVASCVASLALLASFVRATQWLRWITWIAVIAAVCAAGVFLATKPELEDPVVTRYTIGVSSRYRGSWSMIVFALGAGASIVWLLFTRRPRFAARSDRFADKLQ